MNPFRTTAHPTKPMKSDHRASSTAWCGTNPPTDDDFRSQRAERPDHVFRDVTECRARGLSVFASRNVAEHLSTSGNLQGTAVCQVTLTPGAGRIQPTGRRSHYTWWPLANYDILANCQVVTT